MKKLRVTSLRAGDTCSICKKAFNSTEAMLMHKKQYHRKRLRRKRCTTT